MKYITSTNEEKTQLAVLTGINALWRGKKHLPPARRIWYCMENNVFECVTCKNTITIGMLFTLKNGRSPECLACYQVQISMFNSSAYPGCPWIERCVEMPDGTRVATLNFKKISSDE